MSSSDWHQRLRRGTRAFQRLFGRQQKAPAPAASPADPRYAERMLGGEGAGHAAVAVTREYLASGKAHKALRLGLELAQDPDTEPAGRAVLGLVHLAAAGPEQAWEQFVQIEDDTIIGAACPQYAVAGFGTDPGACAARVAHLLETTPNTLGGYAALVVARHAFSVQQEALARRIADAADDDAFGELTDYWASEFDRLRSWFSDGSRRAPQAPVDADFRFGVLDYKQPDNSSRNVGDFIQTLASLGHLVRQTQLTFVGEPGLVDFVTGLRAKVQPQRVRTDASATVQLIELQRDGNVYQALPEPVWAVMFGWYLHPTYSAGYHLPFNPAVRPLFISFHLNKPDALTPAAVDYLRRYGPIGCRDWQTVALLASAGVPAFFSGCITTTVDTVFARTGPDERTGTAYIDAADAPDEDDQIEQSVGDIRREPLPDNLALGREWVERYHSEFAEVSTTRLHSYLPARSVGCRVDFHPKNPSDPRFGGLIAIDDDAYERIRQGILDKLAAVLAVLANGADETGVYDRWRELCAPDVAAGEQYLGSLRFGTTPLPPFDRAVLGGVGNRVVLVNATTATKPLARLLKSMAEHASATPVVVVGALNAEQVPPGVRVVAAEPAAQDATLAAVLQAVPDGARVLLLSSDTVVRGALDPLFDAPVSAAGLAAAPDVRKYLRSLSVLIRRVSSRQGDDWQRALRFAAAAHRRCPHGATVPDVRACVIDVAALRASGWTELAGELTGTFDARISEALSIVTRGDYAPLPEHSFTRIAVERADPAALVVHGAASAKVPLKWLAG